MADYPAHDRKVGLPKETIQGRQLTRYDPNIALQVVERVAEGELLKDICTVRNKMPCRQTFLRWVAREPTLRKAYMAAKELSALAFEEKALETAEGIARSPGTPQKVGAARIYIDQLRWSAARRDPKTYSDRGPMGNVVPVHIETTLNLGTGVSEQEDVYTIDVTPPAEEPEGRLVTKGDRPKHLKQVLTPRMPMDVSVVEEREKRKKPFRTLAEIADARTV